MSKASIEAGRGHVTLETRNMLQKGLDEAKASFQAWGSSIMAIGAGVTAAGLLIVGPFLAGLSVFADMASDMLDMSQRTGVAVEALSELTYAIGQSGGSAEDLEKGLLKMQVLVTDAFAGVPAATEKLDQIGVSLTDLRGLTDDQKFSVFADRLAAIEDPTRRAAMAFEIFGKSGTKLLPLMSEGAAGIKALREENQRLGLTMSTADAQTGEAIGDQMSTIAAQVKMMWFQLGAAIAPVAKKALDAVKEILASVHAWLRENRELLAMIFRIGSALVVAGSIITGVGAAIYAASYAFVFLSGVISIVGGVISTFLSLASGGFGLLTVLSWGWGLATFAAGMVATGALLVYKVGLLALIAISWAYNAVAATVAFLWGVLTGASAVASVATWGYTAALVAAWIWENICSLGITLLITALGALVIAIAAVVLVFAGFLLFGAAIVLLPAAISALSSAFSSLFSSIGDSSWFASLSDMFGAIVDTAITAWGGIKAAFAIGEWALLWDILKTTVMLMWEHLSTYTLGVFYYWKDTLVDVFDDVWLAVKSGFFTAWGEIQYHAFRGMAAIANAAAAVAPTDAMAATFRNQAASLREGADNARATAATDVRGLDAEAGVRRDAEQRVRDERDLAIFEGNEARVAELEVELGRLAHWAEEERLRLDLAAGADAATARGQGQGRTGRGTTHVAGSFSAAVIAGFIGASMGAGETRGEREQRATRELTEQVLEIWRDLQRRPGWAMG